MKKVLLAVTGGALICGAGHATAQTATARASSEVDRDTQLLPGASGVSSPTVSQPERR
jgi:hypothetical protein